MVQSLVHWMCWEHNLSPHSPCCVMSLIVMVQWGGTEMVSYWPKINSRLFRI